jgi:hypothetical protein
MQAALIKTSGTVFWHHMAYASVVGGLATLLISQIALTMLRRSVEQPRLAAHVLSAPSVVPGLDCIWPEPATTPTLRSQFLCPYSYS